MAVSPKTESIAAATIAELEKSAIADERKRNLIGMVTGAKEATNGLAPEEKLQAVSENQFYMVCTLADISRDLATPRVRNWKDVFAERPWACVVGGLGALLIVCSMLTFKPQLATFVAKVLGV